MTTLNVELDDSSIDYDEKSISLSDQNIWIALKKLKRNCKQKRWLMLK